MVTKRGGAKPAEPKQYKVYAGTRAPAIHLKEKHTVEEAINRNAKRHEVQKDTIEQAVETTQRIQKLKAVVLVGPRELEGSLPPVAQVPRNGMKTYTKHFW
jgi:hypothetical protein